MRAETFHGVLANKKILFVASTGGHLAQLHRLSQRWGASEDSAWLTFDSEQSRSLLHSKRVFYTPYVAPRDLFNMVRAQRSIFSVLRDESFDYVVSTGAGLALAAFSHPLLLRTPRIYIESVSRSDGPSLSGSIIHRLRLGDTYTQHRRWATDRWKLAAGVMDEYRTVPRHRNIRGTQKLFVTLGTIKPYRFDSMVDAVLRAGLANDSTVWQLGETTRRDLPGTVLNQMPAHEFAKQVRESDVTITHAGVGSILQMLEMGLSPVVIPRSPDRNEHVDDHQYQICRLLERKGLCRVSDTESLSRDDVEWSATHGTESAE